MNSPHDVFVDQLTVNHPNVTLLLDKAVTIEGINFFGGTMWTDFDNADPLAQITTGQQMNDFKLIKNVDGNILQPLDELPI